MGEVRSPGEERDAGKSNANPGEDHGDKSRNTKKPGDWHNLRARAARRLFNPEKSNAGSNSGESNDEQSVLPSVACTNDATERMAGGAPEQHPRSKNGLRDRAPFLRKCSGNHGLSRRRVSGFTQPDHSPGDQEKKKTGGEAAREGRHAPK